MKRLFITEVQEDFKKMIELEGFPGRQTGANIDSKQKTVTVTNETEKNRHVLESTTVLCG